MGGAIARIWWEHAWDDGLFENAAREFVDAADHSDSDDERDITKQLVSKGEQRRRSVAGVPGGWWYLSLLCPQRYGDQLPPRRQKKLKRDKRASASERLDGETS